VEALRGLDAAACAPPSAETVDGREGRAPVEPDSLASDAREERMDRVAVMT
jgi:hypothetical protein